MIERATMGQNAGERHGLVSNWMSRAPIGIPEECSIGQALSRMEEDGIRHLLVVDGDRLTGIVSNRDVRRLALGDRAAGPLSQPVRSIMTEGPVTVAPELNVTEAARLLLELRIGALPVRDGSTIVGIFTTADALEALLAALEHGSRGDTNNDDPVT